MYSTNSGTRDFTSFADIFFHYVSYKTKASFAKTFFYDLNLEKNCFQHHDIMNKHFVYGCVEALAHIFEARHIYKRET